VIEKHENYHKMPYFLHIAIAPTKNIERLEWFLEKSTEIGISEITPLLCEHSERKIVKNDRLERVIISAAKQSVKAFFPKLNSLQEFNLLVTSKFDGEKYIAHCNKQDLPLLKNVISLKGKSLILIGPEGDFSPKEVSFALENGFKEISLGTSRLRTETAGIVACDTVSILNL
jgi:16S rRNA (uracil1498-N3)-methyltransferase